MPRDKNFKTFFIESTAVNSFTRNISIPFHVDELIIKSYITFPEGATDIPIMVLHSNLVPGGILLTTQGEYPTTFTLYTKFKINSLIQGDYWFKWMDLNNVSTAFNVSCTIEILVIEY